MLEMNFPCHNLTLVMHIIYEPEHCVEFRLFECLSELTEFRNCVAVNQRFLPLFIAASFSHIISPVLSQY